MSKLFIFSPSSGLYTCPLAMTDGAAKVIQVGPKRVTCCSKKADFIDEHLAGGMALCHLQINTYSDLMTF